MSRIMTRVLGLATSFALVALVAACSDDISPVGPGIGINEDSILFQALEQDSAHSTLGFAANRTGTVSAVVCSAVATDFDVALITRVRDTSITSGTTTTRVRIADTLVRGTPRAGAANCETLSQPVVAGATYRFAVRAVAGRGIYSVCYAYDATACANPIVPDAIPAGAPAAYYLNTYGKTGVDLLAALATIVRTNPLPYDTARGFLYQSVEDPDSNDVVTDVYNGRQAPVTNRASAVTVHFNAEHAWPQSCGARFETSGTTGGPRGDLHILFAASDTANTRRSNYPYGIVSGTPTWTGPADSLGSSSKLGPNAQGVTVFEPRDSRKGDVARAVLYFYTRWVMQNPQNTSLANFNLEEAVLKQWSQQDPPDLYETGRNDVAYQVQKNRNPFIDNPAWAQAIDFPNTAQGAHDTCNF